MTKKVWVLNKTIANGHGTWSLFHKGYSEVNPLFRGLTNRQMLAYGTPNGCAFRYW